MLAHGLGGGRSDLPLPAWLFAYGAGFAVLISFAALGILWSRPRLAAAAEGRVLPRAVQAAARPATVVGRVAGLALFAAVLASLFAGPEEGQSNFGTLVVYIAFWVVVQAAAAVLGDVHRVLNPVDTLAAVVLRLRGRAAETRRARPPAPEPPASPGLWPAAAMLLTFTWMELAYHGGASPRSVGTWLVAYTVVALAGALRWGRGWSLGGEGFAALFRLLGAMGVLHRDGSGRLRARWPVCGLAAVRPQRGMAALVLVALGATTFDGVTRLDWWNRSVAVDRAGWGATATATVGLLGTIGVVAAVWAVATRLSARATGELPGPVSDAYVTSLVPIVVAYSVAHYFSYAVFGMFDVVSFASDPLGRGWDLFGTASVTPDYRLLSTDLIAWVQAGSIVVGHVAGVVVAHDRAVERHRLKLATRSQWPLVAAMVAYTVAGLLLLLGS